jgi:hypothetical protein
MLHVPNLLVKIANETLWKRLPHLRCALLLALVEEAQQLCLQTSIHAPPPRCNSQMSTCGLVD